MRLGILVTSIGNFGKKGFYNSQEIGLAKELSNNFDEVIVYKSISYENKFERYNVEKYQNIIVKLIPTKNIGINGIIDLKKIDKDLEALIYFSDTQIMVPKVYKWCIKNHVEFIPYIGVLESHSKNIYKEFIINRLVNRNINVYKKCECLVKTPKVKEKLKGYGINKCNVAPVGLDLTIMKNNDIEYDINKLKIKWGFNTNDKILLFIGRFVDEKRPLKAIELLKKVNKINREYKLLMVGSGELENKVKRLINTFNINRNVKIINKIPNDEIWQVYKIADIFINLNKKEIFGMAILEAMYYKCKVVACEAPGPNFIIDNKFNGIICKNDDELIDAIFYNDNLITENAYKSVIDKFTWKATATLIRQILKRK